MWPSDCSLGLVCKAEARMCTRLISRTPANLPVHLHTETGRLLGRLQSLHALPQGSAAVARLPLLRLRLPQRCLCHHSAYTPPFKIQLRHTISQVQQHSSRPRGFPRREVCCFAHDGACIAGQRLNAAVIHKNREKLSPCWLLTKRVEEGLITILSR